MFIVTVKADIPYPKEIGYRIKATQFGTAASRAIRRFRNELKGKRFKTITVQIIRI